MATYFLHPCKAVVPQWRPNAEALAVGLRMKYLTPDAMPSHACGHPACIKKRIAWYYAALESKGVVPYNYQKRTEGKMGLMKSTKGLLSWEDALRLLMIERCNTCKTDGRLGPLFLLYKDVRIWVGPKRGKLALYVVSPSDGAKRLAEYFKRSATPYLSCLCHSASFEWRPDAAPILTRPPTKRTAALDYWWALRTLLDGTPEPTTHRGPRDLTQAVSTFYVLEALRTEPVLQNMAPKVIAAQRILDEVEAARAALVSDLAADMMAYLRYAVCSELRHTKTWAEAWTRTVHHDCRQDDKITCEDCVWMRKFQNGQWKNYSEAVKHFPGDDAAWWAYADHVFRCVNWDSGFGGRKWASITTAAGDHAAGTNTTAQFLDRAFNLKHNGGLCFDKNGKLMLYGRANINKLLDVKRDAKGLGDLGPLWRHLPLEYKPLAERALTLLTLQGRRYGAKGEAKQTEAAPKPSRPNNGDDDDDRRMDRRPDW